MRVAFINFAVLLRVHAGGNGGAHGGFDFLRRGPNVAEENGLAGFIVAERFGSEIEIHASSERVRDYERWRGEIICAHERMDASFEIAIPAEDGDGDKIIFLDGRADGIGYRAAVADASGAAIADEM